MDMHISSPSTDTSSPPLAPLRVGVVVATLGRAAECADLLERLALQTQPPQAVVISAEKPADVPAEPTEGVAVIFGPRGLCAQRNRGIAAIAAQCDVIAFFDDDFLPTRTSIEGLGRLFQDNPDVVGATGDVCADGVGAGGIGLADALAILNDYEARGVRPMQVEQKICIAYGCNMAFRVSAMEGRHFDERLPLYGWQEDVDFAGQLAKVGCIARTRAFGGVHRGVTGARSPGIKIGFSQIVNPLYLARKGTMRWSHALRIIAGNLLANHAKVFWLKEHIDRPGRVCGNWIGLAHVVRGRLRPETMLDLG